MSAEPRSSTSSPTAGGEGLRIDRWLWCARFFKTRSIAAEAVKGGHVRLNGQRVKPAKDVRPGDLLGIVRGDTEMDVIVAALPARRGPAVEASRCYRETDESAERRRREAERRSLQPAFLPPPTRGRPDKRTRRLIGSKRVPGPRSE